MKILLISSEFPPETGFGGIGTYVAQAGAAFARAGHDVAVLSRTLGPVRTETVVDGVRVVRVPTRRAPADLWAGPFTAAMAAAAREHYDRAYTVALTLSEDPTLADADIVEVADWAGEGALLSTVLPGTPYVVRFHTPARLVFGWNGAGVGAGFVDALHTLEEVAVRQAYGFGCPSRWMVPLVERIFEMPAGHVIPIPNPYVPGVVPPRTAAAPGERRIVYVGRLEARKGVLDAVPPVVGALRALPDVRWRLVGADTGSGPGGRSMAATVLATVPEDLRHRVDVVGAVDRAGVATELAAADVVLLPSRHENFPYTCLEAMAAGAPVVASRRGGMAEMIDDGSTGLLVDPGDPGQVLEALLRVLEQPLFAEHLATRAQRAVAERFHPDVVAPVLLEHLQAVANLANAEVSA